MMPLSCCKWALDFQLHYQGRSPSGRACYKTRRGEWVLGSGPLECPFCGKPHGDRAPAPEEPWLTCGDSACGWTGHQSELDNGAHCPWCGLMVGRAPAPEEKA